MRTTSQQLSSRAAEVRNAARIRRNQSQEMVAATSYALVTLSQTEAGRRLLKDVFYTALKGNH